jgi:phosphate transport system substrate-binding protein
MGARYDRRAQLRRAALLGLSAPAFGALLAACGSDDDPTATTAAVAAPTNTTGGAAANPGATASPTRAAAEPFTPRNVAASLTGSGSSFIDPVMQAWIEQYKSVAAKTSINYQSVGSGQGKKDFIGNVTDFGGSDAYMTDDELTQNPDGLHIPMVLGSVSVTYNLEGVEQLSFSGDTLAKIFLGTITTWDDPAIAADNAGVTLPGDTITIVHRSDGSGTTSIFTDYLSKISADWKDIVGAGTTVEWPTGIGAEKSPGVAAGVQQTPGAIGYVELIYARGNKLPSAKIITLAGAFVEPTLESTSAAAAGALDSIPDDLRVSITDPRTGADAYPIAGFSWVLLHSEQMTDTNKAQALTDFIYWALTQGTELTIGLNYAPLPDAVLQLAIGKLVQVLVNGAAAFSAP